MDVGSDNIPHLVWEYWDGKVLLGRQLAGPAKQAVKSFAKGDNVDLEVLFPLFLEQAHVVFDVLGEFPVKRCISAAFASRPNLRAYPSYQNQGMLGGYVRVHALGYMLWGVRLPSAQG